MPWSIHRRHINICPLLQGHDPWVHLVFSLFILGVSMGRYGLVFTSSASNPIPYEFHIWHPHPIQHPTDLHPLDGWMDGFDADNPTNLSYN